MSKTPSFDVKSTYGGYTKNPNVGKSFYCYTVYDVEYNKFYSGVKVGDKNSEASIGKTYFTSSTIIDFRSRFKEMPNKFVVYYEYFQNKEDAIASEMAFHEKHSVSKRTDFYIKWI